MQRRLSISIGMALCGFASSSWALTDLETNSNIPFSFLNPGARSLGMGSAFVGLADDATAAFTNPAGLTQLVQREVSVEGRHSKVSESYVNGGSATLDPFSTSGLNHSDSSNSQTLPSFVSIVWPLEHASIAAYRHELTKFSTHFSSSGADLTIESPNDFTLAPFDGSIDLHIVDYSLAAAFKANDMMSFGVTVSYYNFDFDATRTQFGDQPGSIDNTIVDHGTDEALGATFGMRLRFNDQWSAGLAYRMSPRFGYTETQFAEDCTNGTCAQIDTKLRVPDVLSLGLSWRPLETLVINADADYIRYAQITNNIKTTFQYDDPIATLSPLHIPNGTEFHVGGEYTFINMEHPLSIRAGVWHDPRHSIGFNGTPIDGDGLAEATAFSGGVGSETHVAFGLGMAFKDFQIDAAADHSSNSDTVSVSAVYRF